MTRQTTVALAAAAVLAAGGWALAQPGAGAGAPGKAGPDGPGRYAVSPMGASAVLVDTTTGRTWVLHPSADGRTAAWLPAPRLDDPQAAAQWQEDQIRQHDLRLKQKLPTEPAK